jgi:hypothetical protein
LPQGPDYAWASEFLLKGGEENDRKPSDRGKTFLSKLQLFWLNRAGTINEHFAFVFF